MKDKTIGKFGEFQGWIIKTNHGPIYIDEEGRWWLNCSEAFGGIAIFGHREDAKKMAKKIKRQRSDLIDWTKTIPTFFVKPI